MKFRTRIAVIAGALAFSITPAVAAAGVDNGHGQGGTNTPGGNAYGKLCQDQSKKHVKGEKGTPFSNCVKAGKDLLG